MRIKMNINIKVNLTYSQLFSRIVKFQDTILIDLLLRDNYI